MSFLTAEWRKLAIANYEIDPKLLLPYLPFGTELDLWEEKCYVSLIGSPAVARKTTNALARFQTSEQYVFGIPAVYLKFKYTTILNLLHLILSFLSVRRLVLIF
jgi:uncharacterized protein YqjF (DUF2071 family)